MFNPDQMRAVAEKVYPDRQWLLSEERGVHYVISLSEEGSEFWRRFKPSLNGSDLEKSQALQCIVAAWARHSRCQYVLYKDQMVRGFVFKRGEDGDLLTASLAALLASTQSAVENV